MLVALLAAASSGAAWQALVLIALAGAGAGPVFPLLFGAAEVLANRYGVSMVFAVMAAGGLAVAATLPRALRPGRAADR
ncbi:hypothetical protein [Actinophytocola sediminis]